MVFVNPAVVVWSINFCWIQSSIHRRLYSLRWCENKSPNNKTISCCGNGNVTVCVGFAYGPWKPVIHTEYFDQVIKKGCRELEATYSHWIFRPGNCNVLFRTSLGKKEKTLNWLSFQKTSLLGHTLYTHLKMPLLKSQ